MPEHSPNNQSPATRGPLGLSISTTTSKILVSMRSEGGWSYYSFSAQWTKPMGVAKPPEQADSPDANGPLGEY